MKKKPLHRMLAGLTLLMNTSLTSEQELASIIEESRSVLLQVINDILGYSKLASDVFPINNTDIVNAPNVLTSIIRSTQPALKQGVTMGTPLDLNLPYRRFEIPYDIARSFKIFVANAAKFRVKLD
jgi:osomolarity two-component system sensor histidine kinase TcsA